MPPTFVRRRGWDAAPEPLPWSLTPTCLPGVLPLRGALLDIDLGTVRPFDATLASRLDCFLLAAGEGRTPSGYFLKKPLITLFQKVLSSYMTTSASRLLSVSHPTRLCLGGNTSARSAIRSPTGAGHVVAQLPSNSSTGQRPFQFLTLPVTAAMSSLMRLASYQICSHT